MVEKHIIQYDSYCRSIVMPSLRSFQVIREPPWQGCGVRAFLQRSSLLQVTRNDQKISHTQNTEIVQLHTFKGPVLWYAILAKRW